MRMLWKHVAGMGVVALVGCTAGSTGDGSSSSSSGGTVSSNGGSSGVVASSSSTGSSRASGSSAVASSSRAGSSSSVTGSGSAGVSSSAGGSSAATSVGASSTAGGSSSAAGTSSNGSSTAGSGSSAQPSSGGGASSAAGGSSSSLGGSSSGSLVPMIGDVLGCETLVPGGPNGAAGQLQLQRVDTSVFPDALCNDGTAAVFNFRPATNVANANKWVIYLNGGGSCGSEVSCTNRWCGLDPDGNPQAFDADNMSAIPARAVNPGGLLDDAVVANDVATWNTAKVRYCSSDTWQGTARDVVITAPDPLNPTVNVTYRIHFLGRRILDAVLTMLRRDGTPNLVYTLGGLNVVLPDLDDATQVLIAGTSGGGAGVIHNLDRMAELLRAHNTACVGGGPCPLQVTGTIWDIMAPSLENLDHTMTRPCLEQGLCTYEALASVGMGYAATLQGQLGDESCVTYWNAQVPAQPWHCNDTSYVVRNHVTTPFFGRMSLLDQLLGPTYVDAGFVVDMQAFAALLAPDLAAFGNLPSTAREGMSMTRAPGMFAPLCPRHENLEDTAAVFQTSITKGGVTYRAPEVFLNWRDGLTPSVVVHEAGDMSMCF